MRLSESEYEDLLKRQKAAGNVVNQPPTPTLPIKAGESTSKKVKQPRGANKTEMAAFHYLTRCYAGARIRYEAITFHLAAQAAYTPDWLIDLNDNTMICVEVKNAAYKHASYGRSRLAFRQAALEFPQFTFLWLELCAGEWVLN